MNITWNVMMPLSPACGSLSIKVTPNDRWKDVKLSGTKQRALKGIFTADITMNGKVYKDIPRHWYMIEN
jgi:hypothetical protein